MKKSDGVKFAAGKTVTTRAAADPAKLEFHRLAGERLVGILSPLLLLGLWEVTVRLQWLNAQFFPAPSMIFGSLVGLLRSGELFHHLAVSMVRIGVGFLMGAVPGILLGVAMGLSRYVRAAIKPLIGAVYPVPKIAVLPLIMLIFGLGEMSKYVVIAISVFFLILVNTMAGVMNIDKVYLEVGRSFHASRIDAFRTIAIPGALPLIFSGIRLAWGVSLLVIVAAEFVGAKSGLGYFTWQAWLTFQIEEMYVGLIVISFLGWASFMILDELERHLLPWKP